MPRVFDAFTQGLVRSVSRSLAACELTHAPRQAIDLARAREQHEAYVQALRDAGVTVRVLPEAPELPDAMFVEDVALVLDELAVLARPGVASRRPEVALIAPELGAVRRTVEIRAPGTLEGGDVLRIERRLFVGRSTRTNDEGIRQLRDAVAPFGYAVTPVQVRGCLHLKSAITAATPRLLLANSAWIETAPFRGYDLVEVDPSEPGAANVLPVNGRVLAYTSAPRTADRLRAHGLAVCALDVTELQKAEAALTCSSLLFREPPARN